MIPFNTEWENYLEMKVYIADPHFHEKNKQGLYRMIQHLGWTVTNLLLEADVVYSPNAPLNVEQYPSKRFLFGPHFGVYPQVLPQIQRINGMYNNAIYLQPSLWVTNLFQMRLHTIPVKQLAFPIDMDKFKPKAPKEPTVLLYSKVMLYCKRRDPALFEYAKQFLEKKGYDVVEIKYGSYKEADFLKALQTVSCALWIGCHESQGFAFGETLASGVPICVWNVTSLQDEWGGGRPDIPATTCAYWSPLCGEVFYTKEELEPTWQTFQTKLSQYRPREFVQKELSVEACAERLQKILQ